MMVVDLDGVLCHRDTMAAVIRRVVRRRPGRAMLIAPLAVIASAASPSGTARPALNRAIVRLALRGMGEDEYEALAVEVGAGLVSGGQADPGLVRLVAEAGGSSVVATASEERVARAFLTACGLPGVALAASEFQWGRGGPHLARHNVGAAKVAALHRLGIDPRRGTFYTDSASDLPLAQSSGRTVLVRPSARSLREFRRAGVAVTLWDEKSLSRER